jgi:hypothetical protein
LKISDTYTEVLASCTGVAASQKAVACVYTYATGKAAVGNTAGCALGTASAGTATTAARSDHVHPFPTEAHGTFTIFPECCAGSYREGLRIVRDTVCDGAAIIIGTTRDTAYQGLCKGWFIGMRDKPEFGSGLKLHVTYNSAWCDSYFCVGPDGYAAVWHGNVQGRATDACVACCAKAIESRVAQCLVEKVGQYYRWKQNVLYYRPQEQCPTVRFAAQCEEVCYGDLLNLCAFPVSCY